MGYSYGRYTLAPKEGEEGEPREGVFMADALSRANYERKGWKYEGPSDWTPGLEQANPDGEPDERVANLSAEEVVKQALDVVTRKMTGTWTHAEAAAESAAIRTSMYEHGSFPTSVQDVPLEEGAAIPSAPLPLPLEGPPAGAQVSMTGDGAPGAPTDGQAVQQPSTGPAPTTRPA